MEHCKHSINLTIDIIHSLGGRNYEIENLYTNICTQMLIAALFIKDKKVGKPKHPSDGE